MGQPITVVEKPSSNPAVLRLETNRPLTGMGHERYTEPPDPIRKRPVDELARRLFEAGGVEAVHVNSSVVTITLGRGSTGAGLADIIRRLFLHYGDQAEAGPTAAADGQGAAPEPARGLDEARAPTLAEGSAPVVEV